MSTRARLVERADLERQHPAAPVRHLPLRQRVLRMARQPRIEHPRHARVPLQELGERQAVGRVLGHAERQRLRAAQHEPGVERAQDRAGGVLDEAQPLDVLVARAR